MKKLIPILGFITICICIAGLVRNKSRANHSPLVVQFEQGMTLMPGQSTYVTVSLNFQRLGNEGIFVKGYMYNDSQCLAYWEKNF